jgi:hypothetical protein
MPILSTIPKSRTTVRIRTDIKDALRELMAKRGREFDETCLTELLQEGALMLLASEGIVVGASGGPRKPPSNVGKRRKRASVAA